MRKLFTLVRLFFRTHKRTFEHAVVVAIGMMMMAAVIAVGDYGMYQIDIINARFAHGEPEHSIRFLIVATLTGSLVIPALMAVKMMIRGVRAVEDRERKRRAFQPFRR